MKSFMKAAAILGICFFMGGALAEGTTGMRSPQNTDTVRSPSDNVPSATGTDTNDTYSQEMGTTATDHRGQAMMNSKSQVRSVQSALSSRGYDLSVDGMMGKNTQSAISRFQRDQGLTETGRIDDATLRALNLGSDYERVPSSIDDNQMSD